MELEIRYSKSLREILKWKWALDRRKFKGDYKEILKLIMQISEEAFHPSIGDEIKEMNNAPSLCSSYQPLFDHMHQEHGITLLESEMADIIHLVEKMQRVRPQSAATDDEIKAAWKKRMGISFDEYGAMQDYCFYQQGYDDAASVIRQGAIWVKGAKGFPVKKLVVAKMFVSYLNKEVVGTASSATGEMIVFDWVVSAVCLPINQEELNNLTWLDESGTPAKESDAVELLEWMITHRYNLNSDELWESGFGGEPLANEQLYELFLKQKEVKP